MMGRFRPCGALVALIVGSALLGSCEEAGDVPPGVGATIPAVPLADFVHEWLTHRCAIASACGSVDLSPSACYVAARADLARLDWPICYEAEFGLACLAKLEHAVELTAAGCDDPALGQWLTGLEECAMAVEAGPPDQCSTTWAALLAPNADD